MSGERTLQSRPVGLLFHLRRAGACGDGRLLFSREHDSKLTGLTIQLIVALDSGHHLPGVGDLAFD